jgi:small-conductance mechanosensitive channel
MVVAAFVIVAGVAMQDVLRNIFCGISLFFDKQFQTGDKIKIGKNYGEVVSMGLRSVKIVTEENSVINIPNSLIMKQPVENINSGEKYCQVIAEFYLPLNVDTVMIRELALEAAKVSKYIYLDKPVDVYFFNEVRENESYLKMMLKAYVMDKKYEFVFKSEMTETVLRELIAEGIIEIKETN